MLKSWLDSRSPRPPERLAKRIESAIEAQPVGQSGHFAKPLAAAAAAILEIIMSDREAAETRSAALDLLAADALITYALEAAAEECDSLAATTDELTARIAALGSRLSLPSGL